MIDSIQQYCKQLSLSFDTIANERKILLQKISQYIRGKQQQNQAIQLVYICTHNSRRSHFGQVWANVAAHYYQVQNVFTYSGGTESTAFNQNAIAALTRIGFKIQALNTGNNIKYLVQYDTEKNASLCFSKTFDHQSNPQQHFAAIMTCSDAEQNCPFIVGAELRIATTYNDPKAYDNTSEQDAQYDARCKQIALETLYVFHYLQQL